MKVNPRFRIFVIALMCGIEVLSFAALAAGLERAEPRLAPTAEVRRDVIGELRATSSRLAMAAIPLAFCTFCARQPQDTSITWGTSPRDAVENVGVLANRNFVRVQDPYLMGNVNKAVGFASYALSKEAQEYPDRAAYPPFQVSAIVDPSNGQVVAARTVNSRGDTVVVLPGSRMDDVVLALMNKGGFPQRVVTAAGTFTVVPLGWGANSAIRNRWSEQDRREHVDDIAEVTEAVSAALQEMGRDGFRLFPEITRAQGVYIESSEFPLNDGRLASAWVDRDEITFKRGSGHNGPDNSIADYTARFSVGAPAELVKRELALLGEYPERVDQKGGEIRLRPARVSVDEEGDQAVDGGKQHPGLQDRTHMEEYQ